MRNISKVVISLLCIIVLTGCASTQCNISVANIRDDSVPSATVQDREGNTYEFTELARESRTRYMKAKADLGKKVPLKIVDKSGKTTTQVVQLDRYISTEYVGRIVFQLEKDGKIRAFVLPPDDSEKDSDLSWTRPEDWEGTPNIPGMSGDE